MGCKAATTPYTARIRPPASAHWSGLCSRIQPQTRYPPPISHSPATTNNPPMISSRSTLYLPASLDFQGCSVKARWVASWNGGERRAPLAGVKEDDRRCWNRTRLWCGGWGGGARGGGGEGRAPRGGVKEDDRRCWNRTRLWCGGWWRASTRGT